MSVHPPVRRRLSGLCSGSADRIVLLVVVFVFAAALLLAGHTPDAVLAFVGSLGLVTTTLADKLLPRRTVPIVTHPTTATAGWLRGNGYVPGGGRPTFGRMGNTGPAPHVVQP
jgi:uncharacterized membrane protein (UPF0136 family)